MSCSILAVVLKRPGQEAIMRKTITASIIADGGTRPWVRVSPRASGGTVHARPRRDDDATANATYQALAGSRSWYWDFAAYEIKELGEGFDDIVKYHPTHEESPVAPRDAVPRMVTAPVEGLRAAIQKKDARGSNRRSTRLPRRATTATKPPTLASTSCSGPRPILIRISSSRSLRNERLE